MRTHMTHTSLVGFLVLAALLLLAPGLAAADAAELEHNFKFPASEGSRLSVDNLAGEIEIGRSDSGEFEIRAVVNANDSAGKSGFELANMIDFKVSDRGNRVELEVLYPVDDYRSYTYDPNGMWNSSSSTVKYQGRKVKVSSRSRRNAPDVHVDFVVGVPDGTQLRFKNAVGEIRAEGVNADMVLDTASGRIGVDGSKGHLTADTGSGGIKVTNHAGEVRADTGSGGVSIEQVDGNVVADTGSGGVDIIDVTGTSVSADTGSGGVEMVNVTAETIHADTGSGSVQLQNITGSLKADTGSGGVTAREFFAGEVVDIDTGSGSIRLQGNLAEVRRLRLDAGSGGVRIETAQIPSLRLRVDSGSGNIDVDLPGLSNVRASDDYFEADVGDAEGTGDISTGSGGVTFRMQ